MSIENKLSELGTLLMNLEKENNPNKKKLIYLVCLVLAGISFYFSTKSGFFAIGLFIALDFFEARKYKKYGRGIYNNGLCYNGTITKWSNIKSYEWVESGAHSTYGTLKITKLKSIIPGTVLYLTISDHQKNDVEKILKKLVRRSPKKSSKKYLSNS